MTKMYKITQKSLYIDKLYECSMYADSIMYDPEEELYHRDRHFVYPKHQILNGKKDFWVRSDGWMLAALVKVLQDLLETDRYRSLYISRFRNMAKALVKCQYPKGDWTSSLFEHNFAQNLKPVKLPSSPMAYNGALTTGYWTDISTNLLHKTWRYLKDMALQSDERVG